MIDVKVCETIQEVNDQIRQFELSTCSKYVVNGVDKGYSIPRDLWKSARSRMRVFWEWCNGKDTPLIPFDGIPFVFVGRKMMGCHRGKDKHARKKQQYADKRDREEQEGLYNGKKGRRHLLIKTKKLSCPALIGVTRIAKFPGFKLDKADKMRERKTKSRALRVALQTDPGSVQWRDLYFIRVPRLSDHVGHPIDEGEEEVDDRVRALIKDKVKEGVTKVAEVKKHMVQFVQDELFPDSAPPQLRAFFPKEKTIRSIMKQARTEIHFTRIDLANLLGLAESWKQQAPKTNFMLRVHSESENLLLCYQTVWQQDLLRLYGREVCFLDAAYRRTQFPLPVYFLCVRSNISLMVVGLFVVQTKSAEALMEALGIFRQWNPAWIPHYILTEDCPKEMVAVETVFTGCQAVLNDHLREKTWTQWLCNGNRTIVNHTEILKMMCAIAGALTKQEHQAALKRLQESSIWKRPLFKNWFTDKWLAEEKRWANAVRADIVNFVSLMNQGVELQREFFSHKLLREHKENNLSEMLQFLVDDYLPQMLKRHTDLNSKSSELTVSPAVPSFLWHRPRAVVDCVMNNLDAVTRNAAKVEELGEGTFRVWQIKDGGRSYTVSFGTKSRMPCCECEVWRSQRLPCEHFCQVFSSVPEWGWESLCPKYRDHLLLTLHTTRPTETDEAVTEIIEPMSTESLLDLVGSADTVSMTAQLPPASQVPLPPQTLSTPQAPSVPQAPSTPQAPPSSDTPSALKLLSSPQAPSIPQALCMPQSLSTPQAALSQANPYVTTTSQAPAAKQAVTPTVIPIKLDSQAPPGTKTILVPVVANKVTPQTPTTPASQIQTTQQTQTLPMIITKNNLSGTPQFILVTQAPLKLLNASTPSVTQPTPTTQTQPALSAAQLPHQRDELQKKCAATLRAIMENVNKIEDIKQLQELKQKLDVLQAQSQSLFSKDPGPQPAAPTTTLVKKKREGVDIIVAMPKRIKVLSPIDAENVKK
ncbi:uncharacterized protein LOC139933509 isoform X2 [Centroberyx gerrardi]